MPAEVTAPHAVFGNDVDEMMRSLYGERFDILVESAVRKTMDGLVPSIAGDGRVVAWLLAQGWTHDELLNLP